MARRVLSVMAVTGAVWASAVTTSAAAGPCDVIVQRGNQVTQAQLAFTQVAYSDGQITPEEAAQAEAFSQAIAKVTADLGTCIQTGIVPPGYVSTVPPPDTTPPVTNTFKVGIAHWRLGSRGVKIYWDTGEPTKVQIRFYRVVNGITTSVCRKPKPGQHRKGHRSCRLQVAVGSIEPQEGSTSITFKGKVGRRILKPGSYVLSLIATDATGNESQPKTAKLQILPRKHRR